MSKIARILAIFFVILVTSLDVSETAKSKSRGEKKGESAGKKAPRAKGFDSCPHSEDATFEALSKPLHLHIPPDCSRSDSYLGRWISASNAKSKYRDGLKILIIFREC